MEDGGSHGQRRQELQPFLERLAAHLAEKTGGGHSVSLTIGEQRLLISPFEQELLAAHAKAGETPAGRIGEMILDGLGVQVKLCAELEKLGSAGEGDHGVVVGLIRHSIDLGHEVLHEITAENKALFQQGKFDESRQYTESQRRLLKAVEMAEAVVPRKVVPAAAREPEKKASPYKYEFDKMPATQRKPRPGSKPGDKKRRRKEPPGPKHVKLQQVLVVVLLVVLVAVVWRLWANRERELEPFSVDDLKFVRGVEQVINRPPSVLVIVSQSAWSSMTRDMKIHAVEEVGAIIRTSGYRHAEFRTTTEPKLAEWHRGRGATIHK